MLPIVFVDSDVIISSLISSKGAAYYLLHKQKLSRFISNISLQELEIVVERLKIDKKKFIQLIKSRFQTIELIDPIDAVKEQYKKYTSDINDAHIVAGAHKAQTTFLVSYNIKHFKATKLKEDFNIILITPAKFLQYLKSL